MSSESSQTRRRILDATRTLLEREGPGAVRMADIARRAGISRQALYLHFPSRADLLVATTRHVDALNKVDDRLAVSRRAATGIERLDAYVAFWADYIPLIAGTGRAMIAMRDTDAAARLAWDDRMEAMKAGCAAAVAAITRDGRLAPDLTETEATDLLWSLLSVETWTHLTRDCGWSQQLYARHMRGLVRKALVTG